MYRLVAKKNCDSNMESVTKNKLIECYNQAAKIVSLLIINNQNILLFLSFRLIYLYWI